jgi:hypothetical protein
MNEHSKPWILYCYLSFALAWAMNLLGLLAMGASIWEKGFMAMGIFFLVGATFTLSKTLRDRHEADRFIHKIEQAKAEQLLSTLSAAGLPAEAT